MKDIDVFLAALDEDRRHAQAAARAGFVAPPDLRLPSALRLAINRNWSVAPVLARSPYAIRSARIGIPSSDRAQIEYWLAHYPDANWALQTGAASGVVALEIEPGLAMHSLDYLAGSDSSWRRTLQFATGTRWCCLFGHSANIQRFPSCFQGLRLHVGDAILIPPSTRPNGDKFVYADLGAPLLAAPDWLCGDPELPF